MANEENPAEVPAEQASEVPPTEAPAPLEATPPTGPAAEVVPESELKSMSAAEPSATSESPSAEPPQQSSAPTSQPPSHSAKDDSAKGNAAKKQKVERHLEKILAEANKKKSITNRDVVKLLRISDATASRYLKMLVVRSLLVRVGKGRSVTYKIQ